MVDRIGQQLGNYRLIRLLGRGSFAEVYLGEHLRLGTHTAVKVLYTRLASADEVESFQKEARTIAHLEHPHIVRVFDFDVVNGTPFLVMSYAVGGTLRQRHPKGTVLPLTTIVTYVKHLADALQYAHDQRLIHRDIKPENMLLGQRDEVLLSDFGIAIVAQSSRYQGTQDMAGTIAYMAPEQIQTHPRPASDQYSLGIVVYEWLSGDRPFHGSFTEIAIKHSVVPPPSLHEKMPTISPEVEQVVMTALAKDAKERFGSVRAFANALEQASQPKQPGPMPEPVTTDPSQSQRPTVLTTPVIRLSQQAIVDEVSANMSASTHDIVSRPKEEVSTPVTVPTRSPLLQHDPILVVQGKPEPAQRGISRRMVVLGLGLAGLAVAGGGLTWLALTQRPQVSSPSLSPTQPPTATQPPVTFKAGGISFIGPVKSITSSSLVMSAPNGQTYTMAITAQTDRSAYGGNLPAAGSSVNMDAVVNSDGSFTATILKPAQPGDPSLNVIAYIGITTSAVGADRVIHFTVGVKSYTFTIPATADLSAFGGNPQAIGNNLSVRVNVQFPANTIVSITNPNG